MSGKAFEPVLRRDRVIIVAALVVLTSLAWADLIWLANDMWMGGMDMAGFRHDSCGPRPDDADERAMEAH